MDFEHSERSTALQDAGRGVPRRARLPGRARRSRSRRRPTGRGDPSARPRCWTDLKKEARERGLWNLFLPDSPLGAGLSVLDYAPIAELTGRSAAPRPGGDELRRAGHRQHGAARHVRHRRASSERWLKPLLDGRDPVLLLDDRARRGQLRRDQHRDPDHPRRRRATSSTAASGGPRAR